MKIKTIKYSLLALCSISTLHTKAQDRQFAYTYQSLTLPKGAFDLEVWNTFRTGRNYFYNRLDQRIEFEWGINDRLQSALYFNASHRAYGSSIDTLGGISDTTASGITKKSSFSFSSEWKFKLSDPVAHKIGSALYAEITVASDELELEGKLIVDKKINKNLFAYNLVGEYEIGYEVEKGKTMYEKELKIENDLAYLYLINPQWGLGVEARQHNVFVNSELEHSALFAGPTLFHSGEKYFLILNFMPQLTNLNVAEETPGSLDLKEYEKFQIRLLLGFGI